MNKDEWDFEASAFAVQASAANSMLAWVEDLTMSDLRLSRATCNTLKISLAAVFAADSLLDAMQFIAKALAANIIARRNIPLQQ